MPCGKESTEVGITQNKGKGKLLQKIEEISGGKAHANTRKLNQNILMVRDVFSIRREFLKSATRGLRYERMERNLKGNYLRAVSRGQNELVGKFKMAAGDMVSTRGQIMEYRYIPTAIKRG